VPVLYTALSVIASLAVLPFLPAALLLARGPRRAKLLQRLSLSLPGPINPDRQWPVIWIHALSLGEVTSALPLVRGLRNHYPDGYIVFSTTTTAGHAAARRMAGGLADQILYGPVDLFFTVRRFITLLSPDLFIQVETDFWPEWLRQLRTNNIPTLLVNGRFSRQSMRAYHRLARLFLPMFACFSLLAVQTREDGRQLARLGLPPEKILSLGNLKFDAGIQEPDSRAQQGLVRADLARDGQVRLLVCGSTHPGEEEIILSALGGILRHLPKLRLIIAPRSIERGPEIQSLARQAGFTARLRSTTGPQEAEVLVLDTLGELAQVYRLAELAFIGGSLVAAGGHNPIEAAAAAIPVLFGPHMEDFSEISHGLILAGGARQVRNADELASRIKNLLDDPAARKKMGRAAAAFVRQGQGVVSRHIKVIDHLLEQASRGKQTRSPLSRRS